MQTPMIHDPISSISRRTSTITDVSWTLTGIGLCIWSLLSLMGPGLSSLHEPGFAFGFGFRILLALVAFGLYAWLSMGHALPKWMASAFIVGILISLIIGPTIGQSPHLGFASWTVGDADVGVLLFLVALGTLLASFREAREIPIGARQRLQPDSSAEPALGDANLPIVAGEAVSEILNNLDLKMQTYSFGCHNDHAPRTYSPNEILSNEDLVRILKSEMEAAQNRLSPRANVRLMLSAPAENSLPIAVRADREAFPRIVRSLLHEAVEALGGASGVVRVSLRPSLSAVTLMVEDNGRGLTEILVTKSEVSGFQFRVDQNFTLTEIRDSIQAKGGQLEVVSRLGVGSRVSIEMKRVDSFAYPDRVGARLGYRALPKPDLDLRRV